MVGNKGENLTLSQGNRPFFMNHAIKTSTYVTWQKHTNGIGSFLLRVGMKT